MPFNMQIPLNDAFLFENKRLRDTNGRDMATHSSVCLYNEPVTWIFTRSRLKLGNIYK